MAPVGSHFYSMLNAYAFSSCSAVSFTLASRTFTSSRHTTGFSRVSFRQVTPSASVTTAAVITALDYLDELKKTNLSADNMRAQIKNYLEDAAKAKLEVEEAKKEIDRLRREIGYLKGSVNS